MCIWIKPVWPEVLSFDLQCTIYNYWFRNGNRWITTLLAYIYIRSCRGGRVVINYSNSKQGKKIIFCFKRNFHLHGPECARRFEFKIVCSRRRRRCRYPDRPSVRRRFGHNILLPTHTTITYYVHIIIMYTYLYSGSLFLLIIMILFRTSVS